MSAVLLGFAAFLLLSVAGGLIRVLRGPDAADRIMAVQLIGTSGVAVLLLLAAAGANPAIVDVALIMALLAAFAAVAFVKSASADGLGDPEEPDP
ncbi:MAG: multiple resistance and pH regulation protein F [Salinarimonadaceae bacterium]|nr:MAG: multiple resistance and pH regulation protein F [Salinarimonadaceae bacterium]